MKITLPVLRIIFLRYSVIAGPLPGESIIRNFKEPAGCKEPDLEDTNGLSQIFTKR